MARQRALNMVLHLQTARQIEAKGSRSAKATCGTFWATLDPVPAGRLDRSLLLNSRSSVFCLGPLLTDRSVGSRVINPLDLHIDQRPYVPGQNYRC